ncbi:MAG: hypothetical protein WBN23_09485, partial [Woeseia sp.]
MSQSWKMHKFGGSSLYDADCFKRVAEIIAKESVARTGVVVSAMGGVTDRLLRLTVLAERDDKGFVDELDALGERIAAAATALLTPAARSLILDQWSQDARDLTDILKSIAAVKSAPQRSRDLVSGYGELWSARLLAAYLAEKLGNDRGGVWLDARKILTIRHGELGPAVNWQQSQRRFDEQLADFDEGVVVIT